MLQPQDMGLVRVDGGKWLARTMRLCPQGSPAGVGPRRLGESGPGSCLRLSTSRALLRLLAASSEFSARDCLSRGPCWPLSCGCRGCRGPDGPGLTVCWGVCWARRPDSWACVGGKGLRPQDRPVAGEQQDSDLRQEARASRELGQAWGPGHGPPDMLG